MDVPQIQTKENFITLTIHNTSQLQFLKEYLNAGHSRLEVVAELFESGISNIDQLWDIYLNDVEFE